MMNQNDTGQFPQYSDLPQVMNMMGDLMVPDERVIKALHSSQLTDSLRDFEVNVLADLISVKYFEARDYAMELDDESLKDALMILIEGNIEISALVDNQPVFLHLNTPGDLARIMSFVGVSAMRLSAMIRVRKNSAVMLLSRSRLETLLHTHPSIVYCLMRNLVRHVHGVARRNSAEKEEMSNYLYSLHGRY